MKTESGKRIRSASTRCGSAIVAGTHEILIATGSEVLTLRHEARDRALFADGAMQAAAASLDWKTGGTLHDAGSSLI